MTQRGKSDTVTIVLKRDVAEFWLEYQDHLATFMQAVGKIGGVTWVRNGRGEIEVALKQALQR